MKKVVITGGNGQLGLSIRTLIARYPQLEAQFADLDELDITDRRRTEAYFNSRPCDVLINCAAFTNVDLAESHPEEAFRANAEGVCNLASAASVHGFRIVHISTDYVFDGTGTVAYKETDCPSPRSVYGRTKAEGENFLRKLHPEAVIIRTSWLYSEFGHNFFLTMRQRALSGLPVSVVEDQIGSPTLASDLAGAILTVITHKNWIPGIYHYSGEGETTWYGFARRIYESCGAPASLVTPVSTSEYIKTAGQTEDASGTKKIIAPRPAFSLLDKTKIKKTFGVEITRWEESMDALTRKMKIQHNGAK